jgi:short-subunit dehydrogenase
MKKILVMGANSTLGKSIIKHIDKNNNKIIKLSKKQLNCLSSDFKNKLFTFLKNNKPNIIINCIGFFDFNNGDFNKLIKINILPSWILVKYFFLKKKSIVKIMLVGSSSFNKPRKDYILYVAAKSALNNIYLSCRELFMHTKIEFHIVNPPAFKSKMRNKSLGQKNLNKINYKLKDVDKISKKIIKELKI